MRRILILYAREKSGARCITNAAEPGNYIQFLPRPQIDLIYPMISPFALNTGSFSR